MTRAVASWTFWAMPFDRRSTRATGERSEAEAFDQRAGRLAGGLTGQTFEASEIGDSVEDGHAAIEPALLGQETDFGSFLASRGSAQYLDGAGGGTKDVEDHPQSGGLAGSVSAEEPDQLAFGDGEAQMVYGDKIAEASGYTFEVENVHAGSIQRVLRARGHPEVCPTV